MKNDQKQSERRRTTSFTLPDDVLNALIEDAERCGRSMAKQVEAILAVIYFGKDVELRNVDRYTPSTDLSSKRKVG